MTAQPRGFSLFRPFHPIAIALGIVGIFLGLMSSVRPDVQATALATDTFTRSVTDGWGTADTGGSYTLTGTAADFDVNGSAATTNVGSTGTGNIRYAVLTSVSQQDMEITAQVKSNKLAAGAQQYVYLVARHQGSGQSYRGRIAFGTTANVTLQAGTYSSATGSDTLLGSGVAVSGLSHVADTYINVKMRVEGASPTTISMKAWAVGDTEPGTWTYTTTDSTSGLQTTGAAGIAYRLATGVSNTPVIFTTDNLDISDLTVTPSPTPTPITIPYTDSFTRSSSNGWGVDYSTTGTASNFGVNGAEGTMTVGSTGTSNIRHSLLNTATAQDVDVSVKVKTDKLASGAQEYVYLVARHVGTGQEYRGRLSFGTSANVTLQAGTYSSITGSDTLLGSGVLVSDLGHEPNTFVNFKMRVQGTNPTTIKLKAWADGASEPASWDYTTTDSSVSELQAAGQVGVASRLATAADNTPVVFTYDDFVATTTLTDPSPSPSPVPTATPTPSPLPTCSDNANVVPGVITNVQPTNYGFGTATISWKTATPETSRIESGSTTSYGTEAAECTLATTHEMTLTGLTAGSTYHYRVGRGNGLAMSDDFTLVMPYDIGVLTGSSSVGADTSNSSDLFENGVRSKSFSLSWEELEPTEGAYNQTYINGKKAELAAYQAQGFKVALSLGLQYPPDWVFNVDSNAYFKNQYGETYEPNTAGKNVANMVFNNTVRTKADSYLQKVFDEFGTDFEAVRAGGGWYGELHYPPATNTTGSVNSYWGFDANAQGSGGNLPTGISANPVPNWIPNPVRNGTFEKRSVTAFTLNSSYDTVVSTGAHRGTYALRKVTPGTAYANESWQTSIPVVSGRTYNLSAWAKTSVGAERACVQIRKTSDNTEIALVCTNSTSYTELTTSFVASETSVKIALLSADTANTATLMFDDIALLANGYSYDADHSDAVAFWEWYRDALINYQNWQIDEIRDQGFEGAIFMLYPSFGVREYANTNQVTEATNHDLALSSTAGIGGDTQQATNWEEQISNLPADDENIIPYTTWIDSSGTDSSTDKRDWTTTKYLSYLGTLYGRRVHGENTGNATPAELLEGFQTMISNNADGLYWFNEAQLYDNTNTYASVDNLHDAVATYDQTEPYNLTLAINSGATTTTSPGVSLQLSADDNLGTLNNFQVAVAESSDFNGVSYQSFPTNGTLSYSFLNTNVGVKNLYFRVKDTEDNVSNTYHSSITLASAVSTPSNNSNASSGSSTGPGSSTGTPVCGKSLSNGKPNLFQITTQADNVTLYFSPVAEATSYYIAYGPSSGDKRYGAEVSGGEKGVQAVTIKALQPNSVYAFVVRGSHDCATGAWGNEMIIRTTAKKAKPKTYYKNILVPVIKAVTPKKSVVSSTASIKAPSVFSEPPPSKAPVIEPASLSAPQTPASPPPKKRCLWFLCF